MRPLRELARTADDTPPSRDRYVDMLRVAAVALVVLGHWLVTVITFSAGHRPSGHSALGSLTRGYPLTWIFQVVPVFFVVGGYANAASLAAFHRRGADAVGWLEERALRLVRPTALLLVVLTAGAVGRLPLRLARHPPGRVLLAGRAPPVHRAGLAAPAGGRSRPTGDGRRPGGPGGLPAGAANLRATVPSR